jgi:hypothetical protein
MFSGLFHAGLVGLLLAYGVRLYLAVRYFSFAD